jgi:enediyne biosynthesis thioesterase
LEFVWILDFGFWIFPRMSRAYEYRHIVSFEETNLVGNVYYVNHVAWQGRVREMFLRDHAPDIIAELSRGLSLATVSVQCEYLSELFAFDEVIIRMRLGELTQNRMTLVFEYWRARKGGEELIARGQQQVACLRREGEKLAATPVPKSLRDALQPFMAV